MRMASELESIERIETGLFIDRIVGGIPKGRITEFWGDASVGKSTLALQIIASAQKQGIKCLWVDVEYAYETKYAGTLGVENASLALIQRKIAEEVLDALEEGVGGGSFGLVVLDSVGGLVSRAELEKGAEGKVIGGQASIVSRFCRRIIPLIYETKTALIVLNHGFVDIMSGRNTPSGGKKLEYHKSVSIRLKPKNGPNNIVQAGVKVGKVITAEVRKDKIGGNDAKEADGMLLFGKGFSATHDQFEEELKSGVITKTGNTYYRNGEKMGVGKQRAAEWLADHKES